MRVVVVGTGIAGLIVALRAQRHHEVLVVTKAQLADSNTAYAQGGIAAALAADDSPAHHRADTVRAGAGLCDNLAVEVLCAEGPERVRDLIALGVAFDREATGELSRGHEAAHSRRRVLHAGGDATGAAIESALLRAVRDAGLTIHEHTLMTDLVVDEVSGERRVVGIDTMDATGARERIAADVVVLASGGAGQLFLHTTNPSVTTGDGIAAAWRAGAELTDLEFFQFHPTALAVPGSPLVSEAVRGEGAVLLTTQRERFMVGVHPDAELAPRDVVARAIAEQMAAQEGSPVLLDATGLEAEHGAGYLASRFPGITRVTREHGFDWTREPIPVTPAAHYWMGGVRTDLDGRTSVAGLLAVGEAACTGVHGANRLASNSLLEALVFAWRAADALDTPEKIPAWCDARVVHGDAVPVSEHRAVSRRDIQSLTWNLVGLTRDAQRIREARTTLASWRVVGDDVTAIEDRNLLDLARAMTRAAYEREESRGAHARTDHPGTDDAWRHRLSWQWVGATTREEVSA